MPYTLTYTNFSVRGTAKRGKMKLPPSPISFFFLACGWRDEKELMTLIDWVLGDDVIASPSVGM